MSMIRVGARLYCHTKMRFQIAQFRFQMGTRFAATSLAGAVTVAFALVVHAQSPEIDAHVAAAKAAIGRDHQVLFTSLCSAEPTGPGTRRGAVPASGITPAPPP